MKDSSEEYAIIVKDLYKSFKLPHEQHSGIKQMLINIFKSKLGYNVQHVLKDISFEIKKGEFFGIVGRNGSGKSTLLKLLGGIYTPDKGLVQVNGSLTPFIELGVGFNPELTGRENVYLNGALLGFNHTQMDRMYDDIVEFAELERFMDQKLKNYSSGMQVRLAFSIAIRANADILLLDEVLAVGDEAFQRKCYDYFSSLKRNRKTVILVTHDMTAVEEFCTKAIFIEDGRIKINGMPHEIASAYSRSNDDAYKVEEITSPVKAKTGIEIALKNESDKRTDKFTAGDVMRVELKWQHQGVKNVGVAIFKSSGEYVYGTNTYVEGVVLPSGQRASYKVKLNLTEGSYFLKIGLFGESDKDKIEFEEEGAVFVVNRNKDDVRWGGLVKLESEWEV